MKVSILSAVRNESQHVAEMIESCLAQTHEDWELLFVDDGSNDHTVDIINSFAGRDDRVKLVARQQALGKVAAFNSAFEASSGDVIVLLAGDDRLPQSSLEHRSNAIGKHYPAKHLVLGLFKLVTFSENPKFDGMVLPKGTAGSRSGGSLTMSRELATRAFAIPKYLPSEDLWLGEATRTLAEETVVSDDIVLEYRIHANNSNPRQQSFAQMNESSHKRARAYEALATSDLPFTPKERSDLEERWRLAQLRHEGRWVRIMTTGQIPVLDRLAMVGRANPTFFWLRTVGYRWLSGLRGR